GSVTDLDARAWKDRLRLTSIPLDQLVDWRRRRLGSARRYCRWRARFHVRVCLSERHAFFHDARDLAALLAFAYRQAAVDRAVHAAIALAIDVAKDETVFAVSVLDQEEA